LAALQQPVKQGYQLAGKVFETAGVFLRAGHLLLLKPGEQILYLCAHMQSIV
jgi:hypothetical protein